MTTLAQIAAACLRMPAPGEAFVIVHQGDGRALGGDRVKTMGAGGGRGVGSGACCGRQAITSGVDAMGDPAPTEVSRRRTREATGNNYGTTTGGAK